VARMVEVHSATTPHILLRECHDCVTCMVEEILRERYIYY